MRCYELPASADWDITLPVQTISQPVKLVQPRLTASRAINGYGQERGGMHITITNPHPYAQRVVYLESLPWFLRPYMHTLSISGATTEKMYYTPAIDRKKGTHLELLLDIAAESTVVMTYEFEKAILGLQRDKACDLCTYTRHSLSTWTRINDV